MKTLSYDTQRTIKALNANLTVYIARNSKVYKLELSDRDDYGDMKIVLRNIESNKVIPYKIHYSQIAETLNNIFKDSAIFEIK